MAIETWEIDSAHSGIYFSVRHMVVAKVRGRFARWRGTVFAEGGDLRRASVDVVIDAGSIDTGVPDRDTHLRSADFFDVARHSQITFEGKQVELFDRERLRVAGDLTIRGTTRQVLLEVQCTGRTKDPWGNERAGFTATTSIDRAEFGLTWNERLEAGGLMVGGRVDIEIEVEAVRRTAYEQRLRHLTSELEEWRIRPPDARAVSRSN